MRVYYRLGVFSFIFLLFLFYGICIKLQFQEQTYVIDFTESDAAPAEELQDELQDELISETDLKRAMVDRIETENSKRLEKIEAVCRKYGIGLYKNPQNPSSIKHPPTPQYQVFYFDRSHKISLCPIYKAGSTSWLFNLLLLAGLTEEQIDKSKQQLSELAREQFPQLDPSTAEQELQMTTKIMTVRHPFERILSAYRDKLENINHGWEHGTKHFYNAFGRKIVKKYRPGGNNTRTQDLLTSSDFLRNPHLPEPAGIEPTFNEFVKYLIASNLVGQADDHWIPYYLYCTPCLLNYQFIAKTETLDADQAYVFQSLGLGQKIKPHWKHKTQFLNTADDPSDNVSQVSKVYFHQLTTAQIVQLFQKYQIDFELFGYDFVPYVKYAKDAVQ